MEVIVWQKTSERWELSEYYISGQSESRRPGGNMQYAFSQTEHDFLLHIQAKKYLLLVANYGD